MPANIVKTFAQKTKKSTGEVEKLWKQAIEITQDFFNKKEKDFDDKEFAYAVGVLKNSLGIDESKINTLKFIESDLSLDEFIIETMTSIPLTTQIQTMKPKSDKKDDEDESDDEDENGKVKVIMNNYK